MQDEIGGPPGTKKTSDTDVKTAKKELAKLIESAQPKKKKKKVKNAASEVSQLMDAGKPIAGVWEKLSDDEKSKVKKKLSKEERRAAAMRAVESVAPVIVAALQDDAKTKPARDTLRDVVKLPSIPASTLQLQMHAFIDGPIAVLCNAFATLYLSGRNPVGDSPEAVAALDACRVAFDACGLILTDVETKAAPKVAMEPKPKKKGKAS